MCHQWVGSRECGQVFLPLWSCCIADVHELRPKRPLVYCNAARAGRPRVSTYSVVPGSSLLFSKLADVS